MRQPVLLVRELSKSYRRREVLSAVGLEVYAGEAVGVVGPNGAGKSTLLGCITGERLPDSGSVRICGHDPFEDLRSAAQCMGVVPEQPFLYPELTIEEILRFVVEARRLEAEAAGAEARRLLAMFALDGAEGALCGELSQGMARKVAIVVALLHQPDLIVLDEVFNGLDQQSAARLLNELDERRERGAGVLLSSHDLQLLGEWCGRALLLARDGWTLLEGDTWRTWARGRETKGHRLPDDLADSVM